MYELFSQFQGFAKRGREHLEVTDASGEHTMTPIAYLDAKSPNEHIEVTDATSNAPYGGSYQIGDAHVVSARNIPTEVEDEETHLVTVNWGLRVQVFFDREINQDQVTAQIAQFLMTDERGRTYYPGSAVPGGTGRVFTFSFRNFNNAIGDLTVSYTPGTVQTMADASLLGGSAVFAPENLVPYPAPAPVPVRIWNE